MAPNPIRWVCLPHSPDAENATCKGESTGRSPQNHKDTWQGVSPGSGHHCLHLRGQRQTLKPPNKEPHGAWGSAEGTGCLRDVQGHCEALDPAKAQEQALGVPLFLQDGGWGGEGQRDPLPRTCLSSPVSQLRPRRLASQSHRTDVWGRRVYGGCFPGRWVLGEGSQALSHGVFLRDSGAQPLPSAQDRGALTPESVALGCPLPPGRPDRCLFCPPQGAQVTCSSAPSFLLVFSYITHTRSPVHSGHVGKILDDVFK